MNKKAVFFTSIALLIVSLLLLSFRPRIIEIQSAKTDVHLIRAEIANNYVKNLNGGFIEGSVKVAAYRALQAMMQEVSSSGYLNQINSTFEEIFLNGTLNQVIIPSMNGFTLKESLEEIEYISLDFLKIETTFDKEDINVSITQNNLSGPEHILVLLDLAYYIDSGVAQWNTSRHFEIPVFIEHLYDPLYIEEFNINIPIIFVRNEVNYSEDEISLSSFIEDMNFIKEPFAPSFLMRLEGDFNESKCCGIESPLNPNVLGFTKQHNITYIDFCNVSKRCVPDTGQGTLYSIDGITSTVDTEDYYGFKLDARHFVKYGVS
jgi:hypothetical protein